MNRCLLGLLLLTPLPVWAQIQDAPLPPRVAAAKMTLPDGFKATLFAGEPDLVQPIAFCFDDRGRVWVAECLSYPKWEADPKKGKDRIVIFEEGPDGAHSKRTVFADNIQNISGIQYGFGGVWVCSTPNLLFIPIKDDKPAGPPQIVLDGWSLKAGHNVFNSLTWGPDGWLYGCSGILNEAKVGPPGTPDKDRVAINCGVWRYHPTKKKFEAVAHGTTNPWGLDFDEHGEMFITNCVIDHLWHIVPGGHYQRMFGNDFNPHLYKLMPSICDHIHWGGGAWTSSRAPSNPLAGRASDGYKVHSEAGGGHAHSGCMIYLGDNWPDRYRNGVFMCNLHGNRINHDILERNGSTYVARHGKDFMLANDPWFRGLALQYGPDGGVYVTDWTDTGECHNYKDVDRTNGRIFKITYGDVKPFKGDLAKLSDLELVRLHGHENEWFARHARRILQERAENRKISPKAIQWLEEMLDTPLGNDDVRALWTLYAIKHLNEKKLIKLLDHKSEHVQAWAARFFLDDRKISKDAFQALWKTARSGRSGLVRLHLAGAVQLLDRTMLTEYEDKEMPLLLTFSLVQRPEDASDTYLALMCWYAAEKELSGPLSNELFPLEARIPLVRESIARRLSAWSYHVDFMITDMRRKGEPPFHRDVLRGIQEGLSGQRKVPMPESWKEAYPILIESPLPEVRERALALAVQFGDERAFTLLRKIVPDKALPLKERENALKTLLFQQKADLVPTLYELLRDESLRGPAIRGLAAFDDPQTPKLLLEKYARLNADEKSDAIQTLASRGPYALALLDAIETKAIPRADINSYTIRQLQTLKHPDLAGKLAKVWGEVRPASADKAKLMAKYKAELKPDVLKKANLTNGRVLYGKSCASCHRLFGEGGDIGPDLTGSQRTNLDYVLENVLDPSAIVPREYQVTVVVTTTGRTLSGIVKKESDAAITLQLQNEVVTLPRNEIDTRTLTKQSMMPDGIFEPMRLEEVRDLVAYLASPTQVALKK
jgi:putative membrane-bound dehydrogenase-like protein